MASAQPRAPVLFPAAHTPVPAAPSSPPVAAADRPEQQVGSHSIVNNNGLPEIMIDLVEGVRCPKHPRKRRQRDAAESGSPQLDCDCPVGELVFERLMLNLFQHRGGPVWQAMVNPLTPKHRLVLPQAVPDQWLQGLLTGASVQQLRDFQAAHPHLPKSSFQSLWKTHFEKLCGRSGNGSVIASSQQQQQQQQQQPNSRLLDNPDDAKEDATDWEAKYIELQQEKEMAWKKKTTMAAQEQERMERKRKETATTKDISPEESAHLEKKKRVKRQTVGGAAAGSAAASLLLSKTASSTRSPMQQLLKNMAARKNMFGGKR